MKIFNLIILIFIVACGNKNNTVNSSATSNAYSTESTSSFIGVYDLVDQRSRSCGASVRIVSECDGIVLLNNQNNTQKFCNINRGAIVEKDFKTTNTWANNVITSSVEFNLKNQRTTKLVLDNTILRIETSFNNQRTLENCRYEKR